MSRHFGLLGLLTLAACSSSAPADGLVIDGVDGREIRGLRLTSQSGNCLTIRNSRNITIRESEIGPCGTTTGPHHGIQVLNSTGIKIYDNYIHPEHRAAKCCDSGNGILLDDSGEIAIQGNVIAFGESNIEVHQNVQHVTITGNFLLNPQGVFPRGQQVQAWHSHDITVENNYTLASREAKYKMPENQEDALSFGFSRQILVRGNYVRGGQSVSGCGIIADEAADAVHFQSNTVIDTGQCGIGVASGTSPIVEGNKIRIRNPVPNGGNTALYVWKQPTAPCGPTRIARNIATTVRADGTHSGWWNGGGCDPVTLVGNVWNAAALPLLEPIEVKLPAPAIPPRPFACAPASPFTTKPTCPAPRASALRP